MARLPLDSDIRKKVITALICLHRRKVLIYVYVPTLITCIIAIHMRSSSRTRYDEEDELEYPESPLAVQREEHVIDVEHLEDPNIHTDDGSSENIDGTEVQGIEEQTSVAQCSQATYSDSLSQVSSQASSTASSATSKRKRVDEPVVASLIRKLEDLGDIMQQSRADFRELIECLKVENNIQEKRCKVFEEVNKCSSLDMMQKVKVARKIVKDPANLEILSSLPPDARETLYNTLLTGG